MQETVVICGAGHGAGQVVASLKQNKFGGKIVLVGDEPYLPYQRPPLSKKFLAGEIDINNASRPIKASELEIANASGQEFLELAVAFDGLSVVVNKNNTWVDQLSVAELRKIWQAGSTKCLFQV